MASADVRVQLITLSGVTDIVSAVSGACNTLVTSGADKLNITPLGGSAILVTCITA